MKILITILTLFFVSANFPAETETPKESDLLIYAQNKMSLDNYVDMMRALEIGEKYFKTKKDIVLVILFIESGFDVWAYNEVTNDYGLSGQNGKYILDRYVICKEILDKEKIDCNVNHRFDIYLNVLACYYYLDQCIEWKGTKTQGIKKYNGIGTRADKYLEKFLRIYYEVNNA